MWRLDSFDIQDQIVWKAQENSKKLFIIFDEIRNLIELKTWKIELLLFWEAISEFIWNNNLLNPESQFSISWWRSLWLYIADYINNNIREDEKCYWYLDFICTWYETCVLRTIEEVRSDKKKRVKKICAEDWLLKIEHINYEIFYNESPGELSKDYKNNKRKLVIKNIYKEIINNYFFERWFIINDKKT